MESKLKLMKVRRKFDESKRQVDECRTHSIFIYFYLFNK